MVTQSIKLSVPTNGMLMQKQTIFLRIDGSRSMTADLNMRSKSMTNLKDPQSTRRSLTIMQSSRPIIRSTLKIESK